MNKKLRIKELEYEIQKLREEVTKAYSERGEIQRTVNKEANKIIKEKEEYYKEYYQTRFHEKQALIDILTHLQDYLTNINISNEHIFEVAKAYELIYKLYKEK